MILDFWNTKLNPVTMLSREVSYAYVPKSLKNNTSNDLALNPDYVTAKKAIKLLGIEGKSIARHIRQLGNERVSYVSKDITYYKVFDVERIVIKPKEKKVPTDDFISSNELKIILNLTNTQLFRMAQQRQWTKVRFNKNIVYYKKEQVLK